MLKTITSTLPALHESNYTVVDVKFETGASAAMDAVASHFETANSFQHGRQHDYAEDEDQEDLQTPNSSPPQESVNNKRKRSVPKKFSIDEDENPLQQPETNNCDNPYLTIVKTEDVDYSSQSYEDIAVPEVQGVARFPLEESHWEDEALADQEAALDQIDKDRALATKINSKQRDDCPICGDKANGLHYGVYTCEGCKNFFKRSVVLTQKKPYICNNQNTCDVRIVIDMSGIKRKGARCQACRYTACLDAGMYHSGYPRSRGGRHPAAPRTSTAGVTTPLLKEFLNSGEWTDKRPRMSFEEGLDTSSWDSMVAGIPFQKDMEVQNAPTSKPKEGALNMSFDETSTQDAEEMAAKASDIFDTVLRDELEKEKSKNRELTTRLTEKEKQLKIAERQTENMKRHMVLSQGASSQQQEEIKRLRNEINRLTVFRSTVRNYQDQNSSAEQEHDVIPSDLLAVSYNE